MNRISVNVKRGSWRRWKKIFIITYFILGFAGLYNYVNWSGAAFFIGALALLYTPPPDRTAGFRFGWLTLAFSVLFLFLPVKVILYLVLASAILLFRETFYGRVPAAVPVALFLMAPVTEFFVTIFSFPIRLWLTSIAGRLINQMGPIVEVAGNTLTYRNASFSVDPACIGLRMMTTSLLAAILLMNYYQSRERRRLHPVFLLPLLTIVVGLNIVANLIRIMLLVLLIILPDNPMHGFWGWIIWMIYVLLPMIPLTRWVIRRWGRIIGKETCAPDPVRSRPVLIGNWLTGISVIVILTISWLKEHRPADGGSALAAGIPGYTIQRLKGPVFQLNNGRSLVYIKPIPGFYYTEHSPMICWEGSGYQFGQLQERLLHGIHLYEGQLQKDSEILYTAWWYDNGIRQTAGTLDWRWDVLRGGLPYSIVNITAASPQLLEAEVGKVLETRPFQRLLAEER